MQKVLLKSGCAETGFSTRRQLAYGLGLAGVVLAAFLTLRADSRVFSLGFVPAGVAAWVDHHGQLRNFPAYALLSLPFLCGTRSSGGRVCWMIALAVLAAGLEFVQCAIPTRWFEWADIWWSWAGLGAAWLGREVAGRLIRQTWTSRPAVFQSAAPR